MGGRLLEPDDEVIIAAVVQMASSLGLGCVAEGVETEVKMEFLRRIGCEVVQGYLISRPMDAAATNFWIAARQAADAPQRP